ncbi:MAG: sugar isomerase domain-containing protein [Clostridiales bacterium]|nr:sugar isomerase domain-containing protein [Clostridiales bacterium]
MELMKRYQKAVEELFEKVRNTQTDNIIAAGEMIAKSVAAGGKIILSGICHSIENDLIYRGGGPIFYKHYEEEKHRDTLKKGDVLVVSSVSGRTKAVVDLAWEMVERGVNVIAFTSMEYAVQVDPVHESGKKLYEFATLTLDNCAPAAEAMLEVEGIEARFAAASGIASDYIMWNITSVAVEKLLEMGITPGILKSANFPGGNDYNKTVVEPNYEKFGY